jgi:hypothetical protein
MICKWNNKLRAQKRPNLGSRATSGTVFDLAVKGIAMRKSLQLVLAGSVVLGLTTAVLAEPIGMRRGPCYSALWAQAIKTDCDRVCRRIGMSAENITLSSASTQRIFVCRHRGRTSNAFGEQGSGNCRIVDGGTPRKRAEYECLCVRSGCSVDDAKPRPSPRPAARERRQTD